MKVAKGRNRLDHCIKHMSDQRAYPRSMLSCPLSKQSLTTSLANRCSSDSSGPLTTPFICAEAFSVPISRGVEFPDFLGSSTDLRKSSPHAEPSSDGKSDSATDSSLPIQTPLSTFLLSLNSPRLRFGSITCSPHQVPRYRRFRP